MGWSEGGGGGGGGWADGWMDGLIVAVSRGEEDNIYHVANSGKEMFGLRLAVLEVLLNRPRPTASSTMQLPSDRSGVPTHHVYPFEEPVPTSSPHQALMSLVNTPGPFLPSSLPPTTTTYQSADQSRTVTHHAPLQLTHPSHYSRPEAHKMQDRHSRAPSG